MRVAISIAIAGLLLASATVFADTLFSDKLPAQPSPVIVKGSIGDAEFSGLLDTGASGAVFNNSFKKFATDKPAKIVRINPLQSDSFDAEYFATAPIVLQRIRVDDPSVMFTDLGAMSKRLGVELGSIIGIEIMEKGFLFFDFDRRIFEIHTGPWRLEKAVSKQISLLKDADVPVFLAELFGNQLKFGVDSGMDATISLPPEIFEKLLSEKKIELSAISAQHLTVTGERKKLAGWFLEGKFMGKSLRGIPVTATSGNALLGMAWLEDFNFEIDFKNREMRYVFRASPISPINADLCLGAIVNFEKEGARVERLQPGGNGPAEKAGIEVGDIILPFDDLGGREFNFITLRESIAKFVGKPLPLHVKRSGGSQMKTLEIQVPENVRIWDFPGK